MDLTERKSARDILYMNWNDLSMADRAKYIGMAVANGVTDINNIKSTYNSYAEGGDMEEQLPPGEITREEAYGNDRIGGIKGAFQALKGLVTHSPRDLAYAAIASPRFRTEGWTTTSSGVGRSPEDIVYGLRNIDDILASRGEQYRDLSSLYLYGNDKKQFEEAEDLRYRGPNLSPQIMQGGRNPGDIKVYRGEIPVTEEEITFPSLAKDNIEQAIRSGTMGTYGAYAGEDWEGDDIANYAQRLDFDSQGNPVLVGADYWDFSPDYSKSYGANGIHGVITALEASALDKVGTPFILKDTAPINYINDDKFFDQWEEQWDKLPEVVRGSLYNAGILQPLVVRGRNNRTKKSVKNLHR